VEINAALQRNDLGAAMMLAGALAKVESPDGLVLVSHFLVADEQGATPERWQSLLDFLVLYIDRFPQNAPLQWAIAQAYSSTGRSGKAEPYLRYVIAAKPHWLGVPFALGRNLFYAGRQDEAIEFLQQAVRLEPQNGKAHFLLSLSLSSVERYADALPPMRVAAALRPTDLGTQRHHHELEEIVQAPPAVNVFARWPKAAQEFDDVERVIEKYIVKGLPTAGIKLRRNMGVFTQGSCFAANLATSLQRYDLRVGNMSCGEEHNNTFANRVVVDWLRDGVQTDQAAAVEGSLGKDMREQYLAALRDADVFVYTMGIAAAHFDRATGEFIMSRSTETSKAALFKRSEYKTSTVQQNVDNLLHILSVVRELSPKAAIVLTVSPVPLKAVTEFNSAIVADCVSKSTLRVAIHEVMATHPPRTVYWPSFEMVRWLGGHVGRVYGSDDSSAHHVDLKQVNYIVDSFVRTFGDSDLLGTRR
jgi:tetratricopeptide (TPR) repeat protein